MIVDELGQLTYSEVDTRTNALAHALSDQGILEGDGVGVMCRNHRGFIEATIALSKLGADALYLNTAFAGPQLVEVVQREKPKALIFDEEFYELLEEAGHRRKRFVAWHDEPTCDGSHARRADVGRRPEPGGAADPRGPRGDPHLGHDRHAEGRVARQPGVDRPGGRVPVEDPVEEPLHGARGRAALPLVGLRPLLARPDPRDDVFAAAEVRPRGVSRRGGAHARGRTRRRAGDDAADPRAARGDDREVRHVVAEGRGGERLGAAGRPRHPLDGPVRRHALQPVRLDRGCVGDDRHARRHARRARHRRPAAARHGREAVRRARAWR